MTIHDKKLFDKFEKIKVKRVKINGLNFYLAKCVYSDFLIENAIIDKVNDTLTKNLKGKIDLADYKKITKTKKLNGWFETLLFTKLTKTPKGLVIDTNKIDADLWPTLFLLLEPISEFIKNDSKFIFCDDKERFWEAEICKGELKYFKYF
jgi:hypothetical protein